MQDLGAKIGYPPFINNAILYVNVFKTCVLVLDSMSV